MTGQSKMQDSTRNSTTEYRACRPPKITLPISTAASQAPNSTAASQAPNSTAASQAQGLGVLIVPRNEVKKEAPIGAGAFGAVFRATWVRHKGVEIAMKEASPGSLEKEVKILGRLDHQNICKILFYTSDRRCIGMPMYGVELWVQLTTTHIYNNPEHPETPTDVQRGNCLVVAEQLARAIKYLLGLDIVHGDIKPENIMVDPQGRVTLIDFGLAKTFPGNPEIGNGTAAYFAPEVYTAVANHEPDSLELATARDLWAFALCIFAMVCGELPWNYPVKHDRKFKYYAESVCDKTFSGFHELRFQHWTIQEMLHRMLALDPSKRATITECIAYLDAAGKALLLDRAANAEKTRRANIQALLQAAANNATQSDDTDSDDNTQPAKKPKRAQK